MLRDKSLNLNVKQPILVYLRAKLNLATLACQYKFALNELI